MKKLKVLELFSGTRTTSYAMHLNGIDHETTTVEFDQKVQDIANAMWGTNEPTRDIRKFTPEQKYDLVVAGFPCQPFSVAGKGLGFDDPRGDLGLVAMKVIKEANPDYVILENVKGILDDKNKWIVDKIVGELEEMGFNVSIQLINALDFSIQHRERVFIMGSKKHIISPIVSDGKPAPQTMSEFIDVESTPWYRTTEQYVDDNDRYWAKNYDGMEDKFREAMVEQNVVPVNLQKQQVKDINEKYNSTRDKKDHLKDWHAAYNRVYKPDNCTHFPTMTSSCPMKIGKLENGLLTWRRLTGLEAFKIQGWNINPDRLKGFSNNKIYHCAGNGMSVPVMRAITKELLKNEN